MPTRKPPQPDDPEQYQSFLDMTRQVGADERPDAMDRVFDRLKPATVKPRPMEDIPIKRRKGQQRMD